MVSWLVTASGVTWIELLHSTLCRCYGSWCAVKSLVVVVVGSLVQHTFELFAQFCSSHQHWHCFKLQELEKDTFSEACAKFGYLELLRWGREQGCWWDEFTCAAAAKKGQLETLKVRIIKLKNIQSQFTIILKFSKTPKWFLIFDQFFLRKHFKAVTYFYSGWDQKVALGITWLSFPLQNPIWRLSSG